MGTAHAQDATWTGAASNNWTTAGNWSAGVPSGTATFTNNGAPMSVSIADTVSINTLEFTAAAPAYSFTIGNAATFTITGGTSNASDFTPAFSVNAGATLAVGDGAFTEIGSLRAAARSSSVLPTPRPSSRSPETPARRFPARSPAWARSNSTTVPRSR